MVENRIVIKSRTDQVDMGFYETAIIKYNLRRQGIHLDNGKRTWMGDWYWCTLMGKYLFTESDKWL